MGNKQPKLERKFSSLPAQSFPHSNNMSDPSFLRKISKDAAKQRHNLNLERESYTQEGDIPFTDYMFLPNFSLQGEIDEDSYDVIGVIAKGAFGDVLKVRKFEDQIVYAMKVMKKSQVLVDGAVQQCKDEASIHEYVGFHPFVVKAHHFFQSKDNIYIVMDFVPRGELFGVWKRLDHFSEDLVRIYVAELALVLDFLHDSKIVYRDMKMENVLIDAQGHLKVTDFGLSKWLKKGENTRTICGTLNYIAPEVLSMKPYGHPADWWSLGIVMYALLLGQFPVPQTNNHFEMAKQVEYHNYRVPQKHGITVAAIACGEQLLQKDPNDRIQELRDLQEQAFFHEFDVQGIFSGHVRPIDYYESEDVFMFPVAANDPARMQEFHVGKNQMTGTLTRSQSADVLNDKSLLTVQKDGKPSYHGTFDCFDEPLPSGPGVNVGAIESDYLTNKAAQALIKDHHHLGTDRNREPVENSCHGSSKTNSLKSNQDVPGNRNSDSLLSNGSNQGGFPQYTSKRYSGSSLDNQKGVENASKTWAKKNSGYHEGYGSNAPRPILSKKEYMAPVEHSFVESVNEQSKSVKRDSSVSGGYPYQADASSPTNQLLPQDATSPGATWQDPREKTYPSNVGSNKYAGTSPSGQDATSPGATWHDPRDKTYPSNVGSNKYTGTSPSGQDATSPGATWQDPRDKTYPSNVGSDKYAGTSPSGQSSTPQEKNIQNPAGFIKDSRQISGNSINANLQNKSISPSHATAVKRETKPQCAVKPLNSPHFISQQTTTTTKSALPRYGAVNTDAGKMEEFSLNPVNANRTGEFGPVTIQNPGYVARSSSASEGYNESESLIGYNDKPVDPSSARFSMPINISRTQWNQQSAAAAADMPRSKSDHKLRHSTDTSGTEDSHSLDDVASSKRDSCGEGSAIHSMKDNKILYSEKTKPKRTKSQEHLPTWKRAKSPTESSETNATLRPIIHVRNKSLDEAGRFSTMHKKKDSYRDAIFNQSKWLINLSMDADAKHSLSKSSSKNSSTDNLLRRHSSEEDLLGRLDSQGNNEHHGLSLKNRPSSENISHHMRYSKGDNSQVFEQDRDKNRQSSRHEFSGEGSVRNTKERSSGRSRQRFQQQLVDSGKSPQDLMENQGFHNRNQKQRSSGRKRKDQHQAKQATAAGGSQESIQRALVRNRSTGDFLETDIDEIMGLTPVGSTRKRKELAAQRTHSDSHLLETDIDAVMHDKIQNEKKPRKPVHKRESYRSAVKMHEVKQPQPRNQQSWGERIVEGSLDGSFEKHEPVRSKVKKKDTSKKTADGNINNYEQNIHSASLNSSKGGRKGKKSKNPVALSDSKPLKYQDEFEYLESASRTRDSYYAAVNTASSDGGKAVPRHDYVNADRYAGDGAVQYTDHDMPLGMSANQQNFISAQRKEPTKVLNPFQVHRDAGNSTAQVGRTGKKVPSSISESQLHQYLNKPYENQHAQPQPPIQEIPPPKPPRSTETYALQKSKSGPSLNQLEETSSNQLEAAKSPELNIKIHKSYESAGNKSDASYRQSGESVGNNQRSTAAVEERDDNNRSEFRVLRSYQHLQNPMSHKSRPWEKPQPKSRDIRRGNEAEPMSVKSTSDIKLQSLVNLEKWDSPSVLSPAHRPGSRLQNSKSVGDMLSYGAAEKPEVNKPATNTSEDSDMASVQAKKKLFEQSDVVFQPKQFGRSSNNPVTSPRLPISELTNSGPSTNPQQKGFHSSSSSSLTNPPHFEQTGHSTAESKLSEVKAAQPFFGVPKDRPVIAPKPKAQASPSAPSPRGRIIPRSDNLSTDPAKAHIPERMPIVRSKSSDDHSESSNIAVHSTKPHNPLNSSSSHDVRNFQETKTAPANQHLESDLNRVVDKNEARSVFRSTVSDWQVNFQNSESKKSLSRKDSQASDISHSYINMGANSSSELIASILSEEINTLDKPKVGGKVGQEMRDFKRFSTGASGELSEPPQPLSKPKPAPRSSASAHHLTSPIPLPASRTGDPSDNPPYSNINLIKPSDQDRMRQSLSQDTPAENVHFDQTSMQGRHTTTPGTHGSTNQRDQGARNSGLSQNVHYVNQDISSRASVPCGETSGKSDGYMYPDPASGLNFHETEQQRNIPDYENMPRKLNPQFRGSVKNQSQGQISTASSSSSDTLSRYMQMSPSFKSGSRVHSQDKPVVKANYSESHPDYVNVNPRDANQRPCLSPTHSDHSVSSPKPVYTSGSSHTGHSRQNSKDSSRSHHSLHSPVPLNTGFMDPQQARLVSPRVLGKETNKQQYSSSSPSPVLHKSSGVETASSEDPGEVPAHRLQGVSPQNEPVPHTRRKDVLRWKDKVPVPSPTEVSNTSISRSHMSINDSGASSGDLSCGSLQEVGNTTFPYDVSSSHSAQGYPASSPNNVIIDSNRYRQQSDSQPMYHRQLSSPSYRNNEDQLTNNSIPPPSQANPAAHWSNNQSRPPLQSPSGYNQSTSGQFESQLTGNSRGHAYDLSRPVPSPRYVAGNEGVQHPPRPQPQQRHSVHAAAWGTGVGEFSDSHELNERPSGRRERSKSQSGESQTDPDSSRDLSWSDSITSLNGMVV